MVSLVLWNQELEVKRLQTRLGISVPIVEVFSNDEALTDLAGWDPTARPFLRGPFAALRLGRSARFGPVV